MYIFKKLVKEETNSIETIYTANCFYQNPGNTQRRYLPRPKRAIGRNIGIFYAFSDKRVFTILYQLRPESHQQASPPQPFCNCCKETSITVFFALCLRQHIPRETHAHPDMLRPARTRFPGKKRKTSSTSVSIIYRPFDMPSSTRSCYQPYSEIP